jgi:hypothetical protein
MYRLYWSSIFHNEAYQKYISLDTQWYVFLLYNGSFDVTCRNIRHVTSIRNILSFLAPNDLMVLRNVSKHTCNSIQSYAYLLTSRTIQLLNPYNIFARSAMYNSFKTITPAYKSNKVFCVE